MASNAAHGAVEARFLSSARQLVGLLRGAALLLISVFGVLAVPAGSLHIGLGLLGLMAAGAAVDVWSGLTGRAASLTLILAVARVAAVCATQDHTGGAPSLWALNVLTTTAITLQWEWPPTVTAPVVAALFAVDVTAIGIAEAGSVGPRLLLECVLARLAFVLLRRSSRRMDVLRERRTALARAEALSLARHRQDREYLALLHDTASATFLLTATHGDQAAPGQIADAARRDLAVLTGATGTATTQDSPVDITAALRAVVERAPITVETHWTQGPPLPASVALALVRAVREAMANVARHAGVRSAELRVEHARRRVTVTIVDKGRGFDPDDVAPSRRGIRGSIVERMTGVGGTATVTSLPTAGTIVRLEWTGE
ncbi:sensor histidine kinase [Phytomonospora endophytica]|uniref:histidine kinase n=1 Tax=Phytomonospora endophytica TaxID=714109 RepID=A0A841G4A5_9ACTN|nr:ATP-binding protein [Phytomonospora endophytica]MBB6039549.1 signal transduction histidine kinase [Phytomonospora endophytica]GIG70513.1 histidine kinase [Phytomonospora endophytica]